MIAREERSRTRQIGRAKWMLPLLLCLVALGFEFVEHLGAEGEGVTLVFSLEVIIFGLAGPLAVWWVLGYAQRSHALAEQALEGLRSLTHELEQRVSERTTELADKNRALERANEDLTALDELKSEFVALVSHELRSPLTNINGGLELLARDGEGLAPARREALGVVREEADRLTRLVQSILEVSLVEAGRLSPDARPLLVRPFLEQLLKGRLPAGSPLTLHIDVPHGLPPALVDEAHVANVVVNLVDNAVKYSPEGGAIRVSAEHRPEDGIVICVRDEGVGISTEAQARLFDRFYRANPADDREVYGHGLGLYFCRKLVEAQGGRIWVASEGVPGQGSAFYVALPACDEDCIG